MSTFNESQNKKLRIELSEDKTKMGLNKTQLKNIAEEAAKVGITSVKFVGCDPARYSAIQTLVKDIKKIDGIWEVSLTTDGHGLADKAKKLAAAGLDRVNINVDTFKYSKYEGGDLDDIVAAINASTDAALKPVKLNVVLRKDYSEEEIMDFVQLTLQHQYEIRFIEMTEDEEALDKYEALMCEDVKKRLPALRIGITGEDGKTAADSPREGTADVYKYPGALGKICFIEKRASDFADRCAALYLSADGILKSDENDADGIDLKPIADDNEKIAEAVKSLLK